MSFLLAAFGINRHFHEFQEIVDLCYLLKVSAISYKGIFQKSNRFEKSDIDSDIKVALQSSLILLL